MTEKIQIIKSLDELSEGDVVHINPHKKGCYIVVGIGEVPEHEKEVLLTKLIPPQELQKANYSSVTVKESQVDKVHRLTKLNKSDYSGWKYFSVRTT